MFTEERWAPKMLSSGFKAVEEFCTDIRNNLVAWAVSVPSIFYRTRRHVYEFRRDDKNDVILMTRFTIGTYERLDDWANVHSVRDVGVRFLRQHNDKQTSVM
jgi:hypothetical protein